MNLDSALEKTLNELSYDNIRDFQKQVIEYYLSGNDVFFCAPTGSGKSLVFEVAPLLYQYTKGIDNCTVLVVSPLKSLMQSQSTSLRKRNISAMYLAENYESDNLEDQVSTLSIKDVRKGAVSIIFASPESLLEHKRDLILELSKHNIIKAIFVDEAHCIKKFGKADVKKKTEAYRPCYGKLSELRSLVGKNVPVIAMTATATKGTKELIVKDLCMQNCKEVVLNPDKKNITYFVSCLQSDDICVNFQWLVDVLNTCKQETPRMLIFFRQIKHIVEVYELLETELGKSAYVNYREDGRNDDRNRLFDMFHQKTDEDVKNSICASYQDPNGNIRVVLCSTSFSMGLDVKGVETVIHYGPPNDIDDYLQESGRAGRDPTHECCAILLKYKRSLGSQNISNAIQDFVKSSECRRKLLMNHFEASVFQPKSQLHLCCDNCFKQCTCACACEGNCECDITRCHGKVPYILQAIQNCQVELSYTSSSSDSEIDTASNRRPQVLYSSDDDLY